MRGYQMKRHATENVAKAERTLCGEHIPATRSAMKIDNANPDCGRCLRVIKSRCFDHNVRCCKVCPPGWYILGGNKAAP